MLSGARHTSAVKPCCFIMSRTRSSFTVSIGYIALARGPVGLQCMVRGFFALPFSPVPGSFLSLDELPDRGVQRGRHSHADRLGGNWAAEKVHLGGQPMLNVVQHGRRVIGLGADLVHFP